MRCPACGAAELTVSVILAGTADLRFDDGITVLATDDFESEVSDVAECHCGACGWDGLGYQARDSETNMPEAEPLSDDELRKLISSLSGSVLPEKWRTQIESAITELILLRHLSGNSDAAKDAGDTIIM